MERQSETGDCVNMITSALQAAIGKWNDQTTLEARGRYGAEVGRIQKAHAHQCDVIKQKHAAVCQQVTITLCLLPFR